MATDPAGNLFVTQPSDVIVRVDAATGIRTGFAGTGSRGFSGDGGPATAAQLNFSVAPAVAVDAAGNVFIADSGNQRVRRVDAVTGIITTIAGSGSGGFSGDGGPATSAQLNRPNSVAVDAAGNVFISDFNSFRIRRVDAATGIITTIAGTGLQGFFSGDGGQATATNLSPGGVAVDAAGNVLIVDSSALLRRVDAVTGVITTIAGTGRGYSGDGGPATEAQFVAAGLAVDGHGNVFIADFTNHCVRRVDAATGVITTIAGTGVVGWSGDGGPARAANLLRPSRVAVDAAGTVFIADEGRDDQLRRVSNVFGFSAALPDPAGREIYIFDTAGLHSETLHTLTGETLPIVHPRCRRPAHRNS